MSDRVLLDYIPMLIEMSKINDIREVIPRFVRNHNFDMKHAMNCCQQQIKAEAKRKLKIQESLEVRQKHSPDPKPRDSKLEESQKSGSRYKPPVVNGDI